MNRPFTAHVALATVTNSVDSDCTEDAAASDGTSSTSEPTVEAFREELACYLARALQVPQRVVMTRISEDSIGSRRRARRDWRPD